MAQKHPALYIAPSPLHGRGVFAAAEIHAGDLIEICPVIPMPVAQKAMLDQTELYNYYFIWGQKEDQVAMILGYGVIYNHSYQPNAEYIPNYEDNTLSVFCLKDIAIGDEITLNYNGTPDNQTPVWFDKNGQGTG